MSYGRPRPRYPGKGLGKGGRAWARQARSYIAANKRGFQRVSGLYYARFRGPNAEMKYHDPTVDDVSITDTITIFNLSVIAEGNSASSRIGRKINVKRVSGKVGILLPATDDPSATSCIVKCMLIQDRQTNGAQFGGTDLLEANTLYSFNNLANSQRFKTLWKRTYTLRSQSGSWDGTAENYGQDVKWVEFSKRVNIPIEYDSSAATGAIGTVRSNNLYWCTIASAELCSSVGKLRLRFTDY